MSRSVAVTCVTGVLVLSICGSSRIEGAGVGQEGAAYGIAVFALRRGSGSLRHRAECSDEAEHQATSAFLLLRSGS